MSDYYRVVECGGSGFRSADIEAGRGGVVLANSADIFEIRSVESLIKFAHHQLPENTKAIILPVAGIVENNDLIRSCPNIPLFKNFSVSTMQRYMNLPCFAVNDMDSSVTGMAEMHPEFPFFMGITWSSGFGARIWTDKKILSDSEIAHMIFDLSPMAPLCGCGKRGCFESFIGGKSITRRIVAECQTRGIEIPKDMHPCKFLDIEFSAGKAWAIELYYTILSVMAVLINNIQMANHLPAIIWKGTFALAAFSELKLEKNLRERMLQLAMAPQWIDDLEFINPDPQMLPNYDSFLGASLIAEKLLLAK